MKFILIFSFFLQTLLLSGQPDFVIDKGFEQKVLGSELHVYNDKSGKLEIEDMKNIEFHGVESPRPNLGFTSGAYWVKTEIKNESNLNHFILQVNQPLLDTVDIFILNQNNEIVEHKRVGEAIPISNYREGERNIRIPMAIEKNQSRTIFIRIATAEQIALPVYIMTREASFIMQRTADILFGGYFGIILIMILYNFFLFLSVRDYSYLYYVIYVFFLGLTQAALEGYTRLFLWPDIFWLASRSVYILTALVSISSLVFQRKFLKTYRYTPGLDRLSKGIIVYFIGLIILVFFGVNKPIHIASQVGIIAVALYIYVTSIVVYRRGYSPAKFFILAWTILVIGIITYALKDAGILPATPLTNYLLLIGSAIETLILSLALANRINILKKEKATSQANALRASIENETIVREQNVRLEEKVKIRTSDLEATNHQLTAALSGLKSAQSQLVDAEKMVSLGLLTAGVAHEINNPINFVLANIDPLKYDVADILKLLDYYDSIETKEKFDAEKLKIEAFKESIDIAYTKNEITGLLEGIKDGALRTAEIVKSLKNFSRIDSSNLIYNDLNEGFESTLLIIQSNISNRIKIEKDLGNIPKVECLGGKINQVFMNLLNNGVQALLRKEGDSDLTLKIKSWSDNEFVYFSVADNGIGIREEIKNRIFEPFFTTKDVGDGTGLGLSISYNIIEMHKGFLSVESIVNEGAAFTLKIPIEAKIELIDKK